MFPPGLSGFDATYTPEQTGQFERKRWHEGFVDRRRGLHP